MINENFKKAVSPVVATALLLVVAVTSVVFFQGWFNEFSSSTFTDVESQTGTSNSVKIESLVGENLYINSGKNSSINSIQVNGVDCNYNGYVNGLGKINISFCLENVSGLANILVVTGDKILESYSYVDGSSGSFSSGGMPVINDFVSVWNSSDNGTGTVSMTSQVELPLQTIGNYNFIVSGDNLIGSPITITSESQKLLTFSTSGIQEINISGQIEGWMFNKSGDRNKLLEIKSWGPLRLGNSGSYFYGAGNFDFTGSDNLDLTGTTILFQMFRESANFDGNIDNWDTLLVTDMSYMFQSAANFNQDLTSWDISSVTIMSYMFPGATSYNQDLSFWDVDLVTQCSIFSVNTPAWILSKPTFSNCSANP